jgi:hypothetical protein
MSVSPFSAAHRRYVKSLYKRILENERNWVVRHDLWRARACVIRAEFERNKYGLTHFAIQTHASYSPPYFFEETFMIHARSQRS